MSFEFGAVEFHCHFSKTARILSTTIINKKIKVETQSMVIAD